MENVGVIMSGCKRQCDWDKNLVCRSCGIDYSDPNEEPKDSDEQLPE